MKRAKIITAITIMPIITISHSGGNLSTPFMQTTIQNHLIKVKLIPKSMFPTHKTVRPIIMATKRAPRITKSMSLMESFMIYFIFARIYLKIQVCSKSFGNK
ncbi:MAG: hypothetical protein B6D64_10350 [Bacteroidetes bacterium 4484_276]|nr:MAG: hypothetical protein B6D64_10350 [Bacteroidetes bacterium 4484_276]